MRAKCVRDHSTDKHLDFPLRARINFMDEQLFLTKNGEVLTFVKSGGIQNLLLVDRKILKKENLL